MAEFTLKGFALPIRLDHVGGLTIGDPVEGNVVVAGYTVARGELNCVRIIPNDIYGATGGYREYQLPVPEEMLPDLIEALQVMLHNIQQIPNK